MKDKNLAIKKERLISILSEMKSLVVAFSGGVDSSFLLALASRQPQVKCLAVTVLSISFAKHERLDVERLINRLGVEHQYIEIDQMSVPEFVANGPERCYYCKKAIFSKLQEVAAREGYAYVADGSNVDDGDDYRPGKKALEELGIRSPLKEAGLVKAEIRTLSREMGLFTATKPSYACLASRILYGDPITPEKLARVDTAEAFLKALGFTDIRVRTHGSLARIEVNPAQIPLLAGARMRERICEEMNTLGFKYTCVDLQGFKSGSMNAVLGPTDANA
jgi:uncharacterized protein